MSVRHFSILSAAILASLALVSCDSKTESTTPGPKSEYKVFFSQCNNAEPYRAAQNALFEKLMSDRRDVRYAIQDAHQDDNAQIDQITTMIRQKPDLLIVAPNQRAPLTKVMGEAVAAGIPVICLERDIVDDKNYTTWVKCDNYTIGKAAG